jgi:hypothetical protein
VDVIDPFFILIYWGWRICFVVAAVWIALRVIRFLWAKRQRNLREARGFDVLPPG